MNHPNDLKESTKLEAMLNDFAVDQISYQDMLLAIQWTENKLEVTRIALELVCKYLYMKQNENEPRHYLEDSCDYWIKRAQLEQTNRTMQNARNNNN